MTFDKLVLVQSEIIQVLLRHRDITVNEVFQVLHDTQNTLRHRLESTNPKKYRR